MDAARRVASAASAACLVLAGLVTVAAAQPSADAPAACPIKSLYGKPGYPSYVTALRVKGVSCATGARVVKAYYACRVRSGGAFGGRCHRPVLGFTCRESQGPGLSFVRNATATCRRGGATVTHSYTQDK